MKKFLALLSVLVLCLGVLSACSAKTETEDTAAEKAETAADSDLAALAAKYEADGHPVAVIEMEDGGTIVIELYENVAPNTVNNFISLANEGFYDGTIFHRVIPDFMIQGGDPDGNGTGGPGYAIEGEFTNNGFKNTLSHKRGVISMGRTAISMDSAGCQFFICVADSTYLDGDYASFGEVVEGMEVVDAIVSQERDSSDKPLTDQVMKTVYVETFGKTYDEPVTIAE